VDFLMKKEPSWEVPGTVGGPLAWRLYVQEKGKLPLLNVNLWTTGNVCGGDP